MGGWKKGRQGDGRRNDEGMEEGTMRRWKKGQWGDLAYVINSEAALAVYAKAASLGWDTRARTRNNRTRICCVANYTISQFSFSNVGKECPSFELRCKGSAFWENGKGFGDFFSPNGVFSSF